MVKMVPALVFLYYADGEIRASKIRTVNKGFYWVNHSPPATIFYGVDRLKGEQIDTIVITEGEIDKLSVDTALENAGLNNYGVISLPHGAGNVSGVLDDQALGGFGAKLALTDARRVLIATDCDPGGEDAAHKLADQIGYEKCERIRWGERQQWKDANETLVKEGREAILRDLRRGEEMTPPGMRSFDEYSMILNARMFEDPDTVLEGTAQNFTMRQLSEGYHPGWDNLERHYRVVPGEVTIVTGPPGSGKSEWLLSLVLNLCKRDVGKFLLFEFETTSTNLNLQLLEKRLEKRAEAMTDKDAIDEAITWLDKHILYKNDLGPDDDVLEIADQFFNECKERDERLFALVIDPFNFLTQPETGQTMNDTEVISEWLSKIKRFASEHKVHIFVVAHPTKNRSWVPENGKKGKNAGAPPAPSLYDIAGSAHWYNKTDMGIVVHRPLVEVDGQTCESHELVVDVQKVRNKEAGRLGKGAVRFGFDSEKRGYRAIDREAEFAGKPGR
uniref:SF4 helicase domain-containing protein n=1 Tax=Zooxanthella nutricula TaxID=1333877 RepID=A0A7S2HN69_9DINO